MFDMILDKDSKVFTLPLTSFHYRAHFVLKILQEGAKILSAPGVPAAPLPTLVRKKERVKNISILRSCFDVGCCQMSLLILISGVSF